MTLATPPSRLYAPPMPTPSGLLEPDSQGNSDSASASQASTKARLRNLVVGEAVIGSLLILAAPFLGEFAEPVGGAKGLAIFLAIGHYAFHLIGGAVLFKAGFDMGRCQH